MMCIFTQNFVNLRVMASTPTNLRIPSQYSKKLCVCWRAQAESADSPSKTCAALFHYSVPLMMIKYDCIGSTIMIIHYPSVDTFARVAGNCPSWLECETFSNIQGYFYLNSTRNH